MVDRASTTRSARGPRVIKRRQFITLLSGAATWPIIAAGPALSADGGHEFMRPEQPSQLPHVDLRLAELDVSQLRTPLSRQDFIDAATCNATVLATYLRDVLALEQRHQLDRLLVETIADMLDGNQTGQDGRRLHLTNA
jgi:hypothetical protein